jgi:hypothetical protein
MRLKNEHRVSSSKGQSRQKDRWCCDPTISSSSCRQAHTSHARHAPRCEVRRDAAGCLGQARQAGDLQYRPGFAVHGEQPSPAFESRRVVASETAARRRSCSEAISRSAVKRRKTSFRKSSIFSACVRCFHVFATSFSLRTSSAGSLDHHPQQCRASGNECGSCRRRSLAQGARSAFPSSACRRVQAVRQ